MPPQAGSKGACFNPNGEVRLCSPATVNRVSGYIIPWVLIGVVGFTTWSYCVLFCVNYLYRDNHSKPLGIVFIVIFGILVLITAICFFRTMAQRAYKLPSVKDDFEKQVETLEYPEFYVCDENGLPKWCWTCDRFRPDRFSHCEEIGRCVARKDHYCPWLGSIIEFKRYKFFMQFLHYATLGVAFILASMIPYLVKEGNAMHYPWAWIVSVCVCGFLGFFSIALLSAHYLLIYRGMSTAEDAHRQDRLLINVRLDDLPHLESGSAPRMIIDCHHLPGGKSIHPWNLGWRKNFGAVFGNGPVDWFMPIRPSPGDPYNWPIRDSYKSLLRNAAKLEWERCEMIREAGRITSLPEKATKRDDER